MNYKEKLTGKDCTVKKRNCLNNYKDTHGLLIYLIGNENKCE